RDCGANLTAEGGPRGRRKLVVALPDEGRIVVIDAQRLLDRPQGSFGECEIEASYTLSSVVDPAGATQPDPEGLHPDTCEISRPPLPPNPPSYTAQPTGMAALDGRLYVADQGVPLVHVLDVSSPCNLNELPPLLPMSFEDPMRVVTTSRVAVSPLTPSGKRFVYALDQDDRPTASLMAFDVSPGSTDRTPIVRSGSLYLPGEQPDRIQFLSPVGDVTFALRDLPREDPDTGVATGGLMCDPNPAAESSEPGTLYRPSGDYTSGARPVLLRGLFGFAMLTSGEVAVIDVEDFDAPCRRPLETNPLGSPDFRGCAGDVDEYGYPLPAELKTPDGRLTVTDEVTCNMVSPHRPRSLYPGAVSASAGQSAPSLRAFPQFSMRDESSQIPESAKPRLLAVPFRTPDPYKPEGEPPEVYVGNTLYRGDGVAAALLQTDPNSTEQSTLALPMSQPRNYASVEGVSVTYEGRIMGFQQNGMFDFAESSPSRVDTIQGTLTDSSAGFCDRGVYDREMMEKYAVAEFTAAGLSDAEVGRFAEFHSDYVQITGDFPDAYDPYWVEYGDLACGGRKGCLESFGSYTATSLDPRRELKIVEAYQDHLVVKPRVIEVLGDNPTQEDLDAVDALAHRIDCCFPGGTQYTIRSPNQWVMVSDAGVFRHDVVARKITEDEARPGLPLGSYRCDRDCDPRKAFNRSRAFEITSNAACEEAGNCTVGSPRSKALDPCSYDPTGQDDQGALVTRGVNLTDEAAAACIVESLTARFAVYRGLQPSVRDMRFHWEAVGGFAPLNVSLTARSSSVLPQRIEYVPELQSLFVTDAAALGLSLAPLDTLRVEDPWPVF
ncbi:MAG TPA: hypothetical protein VGK73_23230, partial [Polyangiaceae bacterium]